jgi:hypothetical protein
MDGLWKAWNQPYDAPGDHPQELPWLLPERVESAVKKKLSDDTSLVHYVNGARSTDSPRKDLERDSMPRVYLPISLVSIMDSPRGILGIDDILGKGCFACDETMAPKTHGVLKILVGGYTLGRLQEVLSLV